MYRDADTVRNLPRSAARGQFPSAAKQILHDLRLGVHDSKRRASAPAIPSMEFNGLGQARKRATVCAPLAELEHPFAANRREETLGNFPPSVDALEDLPKKEPQTVVTERSKALAKQSSRMSVATSSMRWRQPE